MSKNVAVVTGGGQGIGRIIALHFWEKGWKVAVWDRNRESLDEMNRLAGSENLLTIETDVSVENQIIKAVNATVETFGSINLLVNNAAVMKTKPIDQLSLQEWNDVLNINLTGPFLGAKYCLPFLRESKGVIVNLASTRAFQSEPNTEAYSASKGGIIALTHSLAISLGPDVRVNSISPGWIDQSKEQVEANAFQQSLTQEDHLQHPAGRVGESMDIARMVWFLAQEENGFITGQNFTVDGGMTKKMIYL